ncbi:hypothetical protein [Ramlibacter rhizophilus]|uniref:PilZ domain-containing protein n=1 Tax=Ramlibacter rhizophilus TaxID=1781167 RepID=A0A4Z0BCG4_9BURK|nr:hypothetical protein [Ramlibacter rhizophilus]TFY96892.1 hypothetical protein EZ242_19665 [Ramlibacter rhizophilus]
MVLLDRRAHARESLRLRLRLADGRAARTVNVCPAGLYLLMPPGATLDPWVSIEFVLPSARLRFRAVGEVLRVEPRRRGTGVAMRLHAHTIQSLGNP